MMISDTHQTRAPRDYAGLRTTGDVNSDEKGSGARYDLGKTRYELVPTHLLKSTADVFAYGAQKYAAWNWIKPGMKLSTIIGCMKRHIAEVERGEDLDIESGLPHTGHIMCNALMFLHHLNVGIDDRPTKWFLPIDQSGEYSEI